MGTRLSAAFTHFDQVELRFCRYLNRSSGLPTPRVFFHAVSRLGDGWIWYALIAWLAVQPGGGAAALQLTLTGAAGLLGYRVIKRHAVRERPFITLGSHHLPELALPLAGFAALVALSRVVLGLHYPTDVAAGALLGVGHAFASLRISAAVAGLPHA